jgi:hypothetical protein
MLALVKDRIEVGRVITRRIALAKGQDGLAGGREPVLQKGRHLVEQIPPTAMQSQT